jgi:signal transduction histidine kinase
MDRAWRPALGQITLGVDLLNGGTGAATAGITQTTSGPALSALAPPPVLVETAQAFRALFKADVVWLAVRESRARSAVIRYAEGARDRHGLGVRVKPGIGVGGSVLLTGQPWSGPTSTEDALSPSERALLLSEGMEAALVLPLVSDAGIAGLEALVYIGSRQARPFRQKAIEQGLRLGLRLGRRVRNAQRLDEATRRWSFVANQQIDRGMQVPHHIDDVAHAIATDARRLLRSGTAILFLVDRLSGALHSVAVDGVEPPAIRRGQVLPAGFGAAGRAIETRTSFVTADYASSAVRVSEVFAEAIKTWTPVATLSVPILFETEAIGAISFARPSDRPYSDDDVQQAEIIATEAAPLLIRARAEAENRQRQHGAAEMSRLAEMLTKTRDVSVVCERLVHSVISLVDGWDCAVWANPDHLIIASSRGTPVVRQELRGCFSALVRKIAVEAVTFWTPDLTNDPRLPRGREERGYHEAVQDRAVLAVPLPSEAGVIATLTVTGMAGRIFSEADIELAQGLADLAALAMANARAYHDLQLSKAAVLRHEKLVLAGRLAAGLGHELRNPLQNAVGFIAELRERAAAPTLLATLGFEEFPSLLTQVHTELRRAASIVNRLLDYVRERKPALESIDVRQIVAEAVALVSTSAARSGKRITVSPGDTSLPVQADAVMLKQVVLNILGNALDALEGAGSIDISARLEPDAAGPGRVIVAIRDTGCGIPPESLPNVFDLFYTTKEIGKGVGFGLAICQAMIEQHGGTITITSPGVGKGTTVVFELPAER